MAIVKKKKIVPSFLATSKIISFSKFLISLFGEISPVQREKWLE